MTDRRKILIVDDDVDITRLFKFGLESGGFDVDYFNDSKMALDKIKPDPKYDLAILDIRMPNMDGFEFYNKFSRIDQRTAVCFFTAFEDDEKVHNLMRDDPRIKGILKKPISLSEFIIRIKQLINGK